MKSIRRRPVGASEKLLGQTILPVHAFSDEILSLIGPSVEAGGRGSSFADQQLLRSIPRGCDERLGPLDSESPATLRRASCTRIRGSGDCRVVKDQAAKCRWPARCASQVVLANVPAARRDIGDYFAYS